MLSLFYCVHANNKSGVNCDIDFQQYDAITGAPVGDPVVINVPFDNGKIITMNVESTRNITKAAGIITNEQPLGYELDLTDPRHGT